MITHKSLRQNEKALEKARQADPAVVRVGRDLYQIAGARATRPVMINGNSAGEVVADCSCQAGTCGNACCHAAAAEVYHLLFAAHVRRNRSIAGSIDPEIHASIKTYKN